MCKELVVFYKFLLLNFRLFIYCCHSRLFILEFKFSLWSCYLWWIYLWCKWYGSFLQM